MRLILFLFVICTYNCHAQNVDARPFSWYYASYPPRAQKADQSEPCSMPIYFRQFTGEGLFSGTRLSYDPADSLQLSLLTNVNSVLSAVGDPCKESTYICTDVERFVIDSSYVALQIAETVHRNPRKTIVGYNKYTRSLNLPPNANYPSAERFELGSCKMCADSIYAIDSPLATTYIGLIVEVDSMCFMDPRTAFSDSTWMVIENVAKKLAKEQPDFHINDYHYQADLKRGINCSFHAEGILINFGNEGEFYGYYPHVITWDELPLQWLRKD